MIEFGFKAEKTANAIAYLAYKRRGLTKKQICKLLYFADKEHLLQYGRPITGDEYHALPQGHVPSRGLNMMDGKTQWNVTQADIDLLRKFGHLDHWEFVVDHEPDSTVFSRSDLRILDEILDRLGGYTAKQLEDLSHQEPSWRKTPAADRCAFELFFEGHPESEAILQALTEGDEEATFVAF